MKIVLLNTARGWGGLESHSIILAQSLLRLGHDVVLACRREGNVGQEAAAAGIPTVHISMRNALDVYSVWQIIYFVKQNKIDILIANLGKEYWPATVAAKLAGIKIVLFRHQLDPLKAMTKWLINTAVDKVIAVTHAVRTVMVQSGVQPEKVVVVHPGQDVERFRTSGRFRELIRSELGIKEHEMVIAYAGKLHPGKGIYELLAAVHQVSVAYPHIKLMYIGDGDDRGKLTKEAEILGMTDKVILTGYRTDIDHLFSAMDIFALPSKGYESFGMVLIEAMAAGKAVIGTDTGGIPEIIAHKKNGLLISPASVAELAEAISLFIEDKEFCEELVVAGYETVEGEFTDRASAGKLVAVLEGLQSS